MKHLYRRRACWGDSRGVTLVELLIMLVIIGVLAALLVPVLSNVREKSRRVTCLSRMRELGMAMTLYGTDSTRLLPPYFYEVAPVGGGQYSVGIKPQWSVADVGPGAAPATFVCPSDKNPSKIQTTDSGGNPITVTSSYGYNFTPLMGKWRALQLDAAKTVLLFDGKPDAVTAGLWWGTPDGTAGPDGKVLICHQGNSMSVNVESIGTQPGGHAPGPRNHPSCYLGPCQGSDGYNLSRFNQASGPFLDRRHTRRANVLFLDCHAEWLTELPAGSLLPL